jgi:hypothetical protein
MFHFLMDMAQCISTPGRVSSGKLLPRAPPGTAPAPAVASPGRHYILCAQKAKISGDYFLGKSAKVC